jgi:hypothetical protein
MDISRLIGGQGVLRVVTILIVTVSACLPASRAYAQSTSDIVNANADDLYRGGSLFECQHTGEIIENLLSNQALLPQPISGSAFHIRGSLAAYGPTGISRWKPSPSFSASLSQPRSVRHRAAGAALGVVVASRSEASWAQSWNLIVIVETRGWEVSLSALKSVL